MGRWRRWQLGLVIVAWPGGSSQVQDRFGGVEPVERLLDVESEGKKNPGECLRICRLGGCV